MKNSKSIKFELIRNQEKKSVRQAAFIESSKGMSVQDAVNKAKLFQNFNRADFQLIRMVG